MNNVKFQEGKKNRILLKMCFPDALVSLFLCASRRVMPGDYTNNSFTSCEADSGEFSDFRPDTSILFFFRFFPPFFSFLLFGILYNLELLLTSVLTHFLTHLIPRLENWTRFGTFSLPSRMVPPRQRFHLDFPTEIHRDLHRCCWIHSALDTRVHGQSNGGGETLSKFWLNSSYIFDTIWNL